MKLNTSALIPNIIPTNREITRLAKFVKKLGMPVFTRKLGANCAIIIIPMTPPKAAPTAIPATPEMKMILGDTIPIIPRTVNVIVYDPTNTSEKMTLLEKLATEINKTKRRVNALNYILIPKSV